MAKCVFCKIKPMDILIKNEFACLIKDNFPVVEGHLIAIPFRHEPNLLDLSYEEYEDLMEIVHKGASHLKTAMKPDGINIGVNVGRAAGQVVHGRTWTKATDRGASCRCVGAGVGGRGHFKYAPRLRAFAATTHAVASHRTRPGDFTLVFPNPHPVRDLALLE